MLSQWEDIIIFCRRRKSQKRRMSRKILDDKGKIEGYDVKEPITGSIGKIQQIKK